MFGRKKKTHDDEIDEVEALPRLSDEDADIWSEPGPRNYGDVDTSEGYVDMGAILFPAGRVCSCAPKSPTRYTVLQILVVLGNSGIQMSVAAAPRSGGVWEELREEIRKGFEDQVPRSPTTRRVTATNCSSICRCRCPTAAPRPRACASWSRRPTAGSRASTSSAPPPPTLSPDSRSKRSSTASSFVATSSHARAWSCCPVHLPAGAQED